MNDESQDPRNAGHRPIVVGPRPFSFDEILTHIDPAPDEDTERFIKEIYADRRQSTGDAPSE